MLRELIFQFEKRAFRNLVSHTEEAKTRTESVGEGGSNRGVDKTA
jgi:hypothetical protein